METLKKVNGWHLPGRDRYFVPICEGALPKQNGFQREHLVKAFDHVKAWEVAIDVGAYVGFWTLDMAKRFQQVFAFEPAPDSFECLQKNMAEFPNVATARAAVGDRSGQCAMVDDPDRMAAGKNVNTGSRYVDPKGTGVTMLRLDDLKFEACDLLKIDVEGFEPMVLEGARATIKAFRPVIIMECDKRFAHRFDGLGKFTARLMMSELGYREVEYKEPDPRAPGHFRNAIRPDRIFVPEGK